jgi:endonuclease VIII
MEGPSIRLAVEQLQPFAGRCIRKVSGNSRIGIARLRRKRVNEIFSWGKHLVFQFDRFAMRVHFMLWGTYAALVDGRSVTGDYRRSGPPRLTLDFPNGQITIWSSSLKFVEGRDVRSHYDFTSDVLSDTWDPAEAYRKARRFRRSEIADVLLDQAIFAGVGNIIKNEVLFRTRTNPRSKVGRLSDGKVRAIVADARVFSLRFLELRRRHALRANLEIYGRSVCPSCAGKVTRVVHGERARRTYLCAACQRVRVVRINPVKGSRSSAARSGGTAATSPRVRSPRR